MFTVCFLRRTWVDPSILNWFIEKHAKDFFFLWSDSKQRGINQAPLSLLKSLDFWLLKDKRVKGILECASIVSSISVKSLSNKQPD